MEARDIPNRMADALGCGLCVCREDCLTGKPFKDCLHSVVLPKLVTEAEITWPIALKAGYDEALAQLAEMTEECKQMGRREVVEWGETMCIHYGNEGTKWVKRCCDECWQAKPKEWGV